LSRCSAIWRARLLGGEIVTVKCFEDNSVVKEQVELDGRGKVMVVDGGGPCVVALLGGTCWPKRPPKNGWKGSVLRLGGGM